MTSKDFQDLQKLIDLMEKNKLSHLQFNSIIIDKPVIISNPIQLDKQPEPETTFSEQDFLNLPQEEREAFLHTELHNKGF